MKEQQSPAEFDLMQRADLWESYLMDMQAAGQIPFDLIVDIPIEDIENNPGKNSYRNRRVYVSPEGAECTYTYRLTFGNETDIQVEISQVGSKAKAYFDNETCEIENACEFIKNDLDQLEGACESFKTALIA